MTTTIIDTARTALDSCRDEAALASEGAIDADGEPLFTASDWQPTGPDMEYVVEQTGRKLTRAEWAEAGYRWVGEAHVLDADDRDEMIRDLRDEATLAGDAAQVSLCDSALDGDEAAITECMRVIDAARAMEDQ